MAKASTAINGYSPLVDISSAKGSNSESSVSVIPVAPTAIRKRLRRLERFGSWLIFCLDLAVAAAAWQVAILIRGQIPWLSELIGFMSGTSLPEATPLFLFQLTYTFALYQYGCYGRGRPFWLLPRIFKSVAAGWLCLLVASYMFKWIHLNRPFLLIFAATMTAMAIVEWLVLRATYSSLKARGLGAKRLLVVGTAQSSAWVLHDLISAPAAGVQVLGLVTDEEAPSLPAGTQGVRIFKKIENTARLAARTHAEEVVLCLPDWPADKLVEMLQALWPLGVRVYLLSPGLSVHLRRIELPQRAFHGLALLDFGRSPMARHVPRSKRIADVALTSVLLILGAPILLFIGLFIWVTDGRPIFYKQIRTGSQGRLFSMWKFRTMHVGADGQMDELRDHNEADGPLFKIKNDPRVTRFGAFLRRHSLDELPQLWNVLRGEMSLVGPRPPIPEEVKHYQDWHHARLAGVVACTGLWQVSGRSDIPFDEMCLLDIYYLHNMGPRLDLKILVKTIWTVLAGHGAY